VRHATAREDNVAGDTFDGGVSDFQATAIAVYSVPSVHMRIRDTVIRHNEVGVWFTNTAHARGLGDNPYRDTPKHVVVEPPN
jgi:hypothetical protein